MIVTRFNFETNSSSQHSLSCRKESGTYPETEIFRSEEQIHDVQQDAIIVMKQDCYCTDNLLEGVWPHNNNVHIYGSDLDFRNSAMQVLTTFKQKLDYTLATILGKKTRGWEDRKHTVYSLLTKLLPDITFDYETVLRRRWSYGSINKNILFPFLREHKVSLEEFLTNKKYIVIVNYAEYCKMRFLNMIDENNIDFEYHTVENQEGTINIVDGVWKINEADLIFGRSPFRVLGTIEGKARYALAANHNTASVVSILQEVYPDLEKIEVIPEDPEYPIDDDFLGYCEDCAIPTGISMREFILNKKYVIISDGDEYCIWSDFKSTPLFNQEAYDAGTKTDEYD